MRLSAPALSKRKLPSQSRRTRCSKPGHSGSGLTHPQHNFCVLRLRARRSERCDGPQPYRVTEGPDPRPTHSGGSQPHPLLVKELEFSGRGKGNARH